MKNFLVILDGPMGSGKSTVASLLFHKLDRTAFLSYDAQKWTISGFGTEPSDKEMMARAREVLAQEYIKHGLNIVMDAGFTLGTRMERFIELAKRNNYKLLVYQFDAPEEVLMERAKNRPKPDSEITKISDERIRENLESYREKKYQGKEVKLIDSHNLSSEQIAGIIPEDIQD